jgi:hypothetical protein
MPVQRSSVTSTITEQPRVPFSSTTAKVPSKAGAAADYVCERVKNISIAAKALHTLAKFGVNHGTEAVCGAATIATGLGMAWAGNLFSGLSLVTAGGKQFYNILKPNETDAKQLLQDARAGVDMITLLEKANQDSFTKVDSNLESVARNIKNLEEGLNSIQSMADHGSKKIRAQKEKATFLYQEAMVLFSKAQETFMNAQSNIRDANSQFAVALSRIEDLVELANSDGGDPKSKIEEFNRLAQEVQSECTEAKEKLDHGNEVLNDGNKFLDQALAKFVDASTESGKAIGIAFSKLDKIKERAKRAVIESECQNQVQTIRQELVEVKARSNDILAIAQQVDQDLGKAEELNEKQYGLESIVIGGVAGAYFLGPYGAPLGIVAYHNREKISNLLFGADAKPEPVQPTIAEPVTYAFNNHSTGFWGRYIQKKSSETAGIAAIDLGNNEKLEINFNFNNKETVSRKELKKVYDKLSEKLSANKMTPQDCLNVIKKLETIQINRGSRGNTTGFIKSNDVYFTELTRRCSSQMSQSA